MSFNIEVLMPRQLSSQEIEILAHPVANPQAWWDRANASSKIDAEKALREKIARWDPIYRADKSVKGQGYKNRAARIAAGEAA